MMFSIGLHLSKNLIDEREADSKDFRFEIQSAGDVTDISCTYLADPFLFQDGDIWYLFTEAVNNDCQKGEIVLSVSTDGLKSFQYSQTVLSESWHLSWPFVLEHQGVHYMLPCATAGLPSPKAARFLWLYESSGSDWPYRWERKRQILFDRLNLEARPLDPVLYFHKPDQTWYLMTLDDGLGQERVYFSDRIDGGYIEHPQSKQYSWRQAGRFAQHDGITWAFFQTQTDSGTGLKVTARKIEELSRARFRYSEESVVVAGPSQKIRHALQGMHTFDAHRLGSMWVAAVDGWFFDYEHLMWWCLAASEQNSLCWHQISQGESVNAFRALRCDCINHNLWEAGLLYNSSISTLLDNVCPLNQLSSEASILQLLKDSSVVEYGCSEWTLFYARCAGQWTSVGIDDSTCSEVMAVKPDNVRVKTQFVSSDSSSPANSSNGGKELSVCATSIAAELSHSNDARLIVLDRRGGSTCATEIRPLLSRTTYVVLHKGVLEPDWWEASLGLLLRLYQVAARGEDRIVLQLTKDS